MPTPRWNSSALLRQIGTAAAVIAAAMIANFAVAAEPAVPRKPSIEELALGRELFLREWLPNDPRSHGGDGLGPVFNDTSCVACHNQGGPGGGGPASKNVDLVSAFPRDAVEPSSDKEDAGDRGFFWNAFRATIGLPTVPGKAAASEKPKFEIEKLVKFHPGFRTARSVVLHRAGTEREFASWHPVNVHFRDPFSSVFSPPPEPARFEPPWEVWRKGDRALAIWLTIQRAKEPLMRVTENVGEQLELAITPDPSGREIGLPKEAMLVRLLAISPMARSQLLPAVLNEPDRGEAALLPSQRNPIALFGAGLIDSIPNSVIEQAAQTRYHAFPAVKGRVSRLRDGRIGRFGWKGQTASLRDFTLTACAIELGLNVPGHEQAVVPYKPDYRPPGLDMNEPECDALVRFIAALAAPGRAKTSHTEQAAYLEAGEKRFSETGCAACHRPSLGEASGIYSDLMLHDMGPALADSGLYGAAIPESDDEDGAESDRDAVPAGNVEVSTAVSGARSPKSSFRAARRSEWRTPPLWGLRDSGPYLHDGRAETIQDAIAMHGGEALLSTNKFFKLSHEKRQQLISFLKSLTAPEAAAVR